MLIKKSKLHSWEVTGSRYEHIFKLSFIMNTLYCISIKSINCHQHYLKQLKYDSVLSKKRIILKACGAQGKSLLFTQQEMTVAKHKTHNGQLQRKNSMDKDEEDGEDIILKAAILYQLQITWIFKMFTTGITLEWSTLGLLLLLHSRKASRSLSIQI